MELIDKAAVVAEIERRIADIVNECSKSKHPQFTLYGKIKALENLLTFINTLEVKEVDLEKLGEIARHLIAVKEHIEDMRLDKEELFILEKIAYPERLKAQKGE